MSLDIDNWSLAEPWFASHGVDLGDLFTSPDAVHIKSGVPNKGKLLFKIPVPMVHYVVRDEGETVVEFRCMNSTGGSLQDVLPPSIHPDTGSPYTWHGNFKDIKVAPEVLLELWQSLLDEKEQSRQVRKESTEIQGTTDVDAIQRALDKVPASSLSYEDWYRVGMAIHSELPGDEGLQLFEQWSAIDKGRYDLEVIIDKWTSFKSGGGITIGSLFGMVPKSSVEFPPIEDSVTAVDTQTVTPVQSFSNEETEELLETSLLVPGNFIDNIDSGNSIFRTAKKLGKLYRKERGVFQLLGSGRLQEVNAKMLPSIVDGLSRDSGKPIVGVFAGTHGNQTVKNSRLKITESEILLASSTVEELDEIRILSPTPFITQDGKILREGYYQDYQVLVTGGDVTEVPFDEAVEALDSLLDDFLPFSPADKSRMMASLITPALKPGKIVIQSPMFFFSSDQSQSGKGLYAETAPCIYDCIAENVMSGDSGAGSMKEVTHGALLSGRQFINFDNFRGSLKADWLESLITAHQDSVSSRVPYGRLTTVDPAACNWGMTSNGVRSTEDLVNRMCIVKLRKQDAGHKFRYESKEGFHSYVRSRQPYYLGCVLSVVKRWIEDGRPEGESGGHSFITWSKILDYIVQEYFGYEPLMRGMEESKLTISNPLTVWVRAVCIAVASDGKLGQSLSAGNLADTLMTSSGDASMLPSGTSLHDVESPRLAVGKAMSQVRKSVKGTEDEHSMDVEGYNIDWYETRRIDGTYLDNATHVYTVTKVDAEDASDVPF